MAPKDLSITEFSSECGRALDVRFEAWLSSLKFLAESGWGRIISQPFSQTICCRATPATSASATKLSPYKLRSMHVGSGRRFGTVETGSRSTAHWRCRLATFHLVQRHSRATPIWHRARLISGLLRHQ